MTVVTVKAVCSGETSASVGQRTKTPAPAVRRDAECKRYCLKCPLFGQIAPRTVPGLRLQRAPRIEDYGKADLDPIGQ